MICNVGDEIKVKEGVDEVLALFGRIDGCFANAGIMMPPKDFIETSYEEWKKVLSINVDGVFLTYKYVVKHMIDRANKGDAFGRLVVTSSTASRMGTARNVHYGTGKSAVNGLSRALAVELAKYKITSNAILPGWVESDLTNDLYKNDKFQEKVISRVPLKRWGKGDDFEGIAAYLMSDFSSFHTGDEILIDGGYTQF
jgi:NAD(P)-dependent dehydrogenase (short-subunit alcohol dehydrogenase family)